ncbi:unnamed protein product, partial [Didymodactylos carnosus]
VGKLASTVPVIAARALEQFLEEIVTKTLFITTSRSAKTLTPEHIRDMIFSDHRLAFLHELANKTCNVKTTHRSISTSSPISTPTAMSSINQQQKNLQQEQHFTFSPLPMTPNLFIPIDLSKISSPPQQPLISTQLSRSYSDPAYLMPITSDQQKQLEQQQNLNPLHTYYIFVEHHFLKKMSDSVSSSANDVLSGDTKIQWYDFRPNKKLLNPKFDGYRLSLDPLAQYVLKFDNDIQVQSEIDLNDELYIYNCIKAYKSLNHLYYDQWTSNENNDKLYFIDKNCSIFYINVTDDLSHLQQPTCVYQIPSTNKTSNGSMIFVSEKIVLINDGAQKLFIVNNENKKWTLIHQEDLLQDDETFSTRLLHSVIFEQYLHVLIGYVDNKTQYTSDNTKIKTNQCKLIWLTYSLTQIKCVRTRKLEGKKWLDYAAIEMNGEALYIAADCAYQFIYDSMIEVKKPVIPSTLHRIESKYKYRWSETSETISISVDNIPTEGEQKLNVKFDVDCMQCKIGDEVLFDGHLFDSVEIEKSSYRIEDDKLQIMLQKKTPNSIWNDVLKDGEAIEGEMGFVDENSTTTTKLDGQEVEENNKNPQQPFNIQQLEECDQYTNEDDAYLQRLCGNTHRVTHQATLINQILFTTRLTKSELPAICLRHDVDGLIWQLHCVKDENSAPWTHEATFSAFGYVQASKQQRKFISCPLDFSYVVICDMKTHLYLYKQNSTDNLPGTSLRNRKTGQVISTIAKQYMISLENHDEILGNIMDAFFQNPTSTSPNNSSLSFENVSKILAKEPFAMCTQAALLAIRECPFNRSELSQLANRFVFCHTQTTTNPPPPPPPSTTPQVPILPPPPQLIWIKSLNNVQELHCLDLIRQFLENERDVVTCKRLFEILYVDILLDQRNPLFMLYFNSFLKFLSLLISFESKQTLTMIAQWFLTFNPLPSSPSTSNTTSSISPTPPSTSDLLSKIVEHLIHDHVSLATTNSIKNLCSISPLFTLCFISQTCLLLDKDLIGTHLDTQTVQILIELLTYWLTNYTNLLLATLQQCYSQEQSVTAQRSTVLAKSNQLYFNFLPPMIRLNVLFPIRSVEIFLSNQNNTTGINTLRTNMDYLHTSILSFLFSIVNDQQQQHQYVRYLLPPNYFEQLSLNIYDIIGKEGPDKTSVDDCIQRYLQILAIAKTHPSTLTQIKIRELGKQIPLLTRHKLFGVLQRKEQQESKKK